MRQRETMCPACDRVVGVHVWNQTWSENRSAARPNPGVIWKVTRHHNLERKWCLGSGMSVPSSVIIPVRVSA